MLSASDRFHISVNYAETIPTLRWRKFTALTKDNIIPPPPSKFPVGTFSSRLLYTIKSLKLSILWARNPKTLRIHWVEKKSFVLRSNNRLFRSFLVLFFCNNQNYFYNLLKHLISPRIVDSFRFLFLLYLLGVWLWKAVPWAIIYMS